MTVVAAVSALSLAASHAPAVRAVPFSFMALMERLETGPDRS